MLPVNDAPPPIVYPPIPTVGTGPGREVEAVLAERPRERLAAGPGPTAAVRAIGSIFASVQ